MKLFGKAPFRISFYGGGTDIEPYPSDFGGCCISYSINIGCFASIDLDTDKKIIEDLNSKKKIIFNKNLKNGKLFKIFEVSKKFSSYHLKYYFEANTGSGLGSSGSFIALLAAFLNKIDNKKLKKEKIANDAFYFEKKILGTSGGRQDEFSSVYGGFNYLDFKKNGITNVTKLNASSDFKKNLQKKSLLMFTGITRNGSKIIDKHIKLYNNGGNIEILHEIKNLAIKAKKYVQKNDIKSFIKDINYYWDLKKKFNPNVTNENIDRLITVAKQEGAYSAKLLGAGKGGHLLIFCEPNSRNRIINKLSQYGCVKKEFKYLDQGLILSN